MQNTRMFLDRNVTDIGRLEEVGDHEIQAEAKYLIIIIITIIMTIIIIIKMTIIIIAIMIIMITIITIMMT